MEITINKNWSGAYITVKADNVNIEEDIEERIYYKTEDGKSDFTRAAKKDIKTDVLQQFAQTLEDLIYFRESEFDSSGLIGYLFEKLPEEKVKNLLKELNNSYGE